MSRYFILMTVLIFSLAMTSCGPSREIADKKLAKACEGAIRALYGQNDKIDIRKTSFLSQKGHGGVDLRAVKLEADYVRDGGIVEEKSWTCSYKETRSLLGYLPEFYSLEKDGEQYGNFGGKIVGDLEALIKINAETEKALY